jgi:hypothetical protein
MVLRQTLMNAELYGILGPHGSEDIKMKLFKIN